MSAPEQEPEARAASQERLAAVAPSPADCGGQGDSPSPPVVPSASALDRVLWQLGIRNAVVLMSLGLRSMDLLAAQQELDRLRADLADLADVARLEAWLRTEWAKHVAEALAEYDEEWCDLMEARRWTSRRLDRSELQTQRGILLETIAEVQTRFAALGAAVATEGT